MKKGALRPGDPGAEGFGAVHGGTAAKGDDGLTAVVQIHFPGFFGVSYGGVGDGLIVHGAENAGFG